MKSYLLKMPYQSNLSIKTDCALFASNLKMKYGDYLFELEKNESEHFRVVVLKNGECNCLVYIDGVSTNTAAPINYLSRYLFDHATYESHILAWHGAAVEMNKKSYIFLAATTTGKTTLTSYLTSRGCGYITDDCVLLDKNSYKIHPCSTPLHLREGGVAILKKYNATPQNMQKIGEKGMACRYAYLPKNSVKTSLPIGEIFFLERTDAENAVCSMTYIEKMTELLKAPITTYPITKDYLKLLANIGKLHCKKLKYCDMSYVLEVIKYHEIGTIT